MSQAFRLQAGSPRMRGFTLVEALVTVAIVGLLVAILLPAVQAAREAARRGRCLNNLRQMGIALNAYESAHKVYPQGRNGRFSLHVMLLPYLEQRALYGAINFEAGIWATDRITGPNATVINTDVDVFLCPSDFADPLPGRQNYVGDSGFGDCIDPSPLERLGMFTDGSTTGKLVYYGPEAVRDGVSQTIAISEWNLGRYPVRDARASVFKITPSLIEEDEFEDFVAACANLDAGSVRIGLIGKPANWVNPGIGSSLFDNDLPINGHSCTNDGSINYGAWTAGSRHPGGANAVFADGHAQFLRETIAAPLWRALGTRCGGEVVDAAAF